MRSCVTLTVLVAALVAQISAIQVECRQCHILRQNEEYFEQAKRATSKRHKCASPMVSEVSDVSSDVPLEENLQPEAPLVETAATKGKLGARMSVLPYWY